MKSEKKSNNYRWYILILAAITNAVSVAIPTMSLSVLLPEISADLNLSLVQAGWVWGFYSFPSIFTGIIGGAFGDRFGPKRIITISCILLAITGSIRGLAWNFSTMVIGSLLYGVLTPVISMNNLKTAGLWFPNKELGLASGVVAMGMASGFMIGSSVSATFLSPWLGGWRYVFLFYGIITGLLAIPWFFTRPKPENADLKSAQNTDMSLLDGMLNVARIKNIWLIGLTAMGINGAIQGLMGYLPLYLRSIGWAGASADGTLSALYAASLIFVLPIALLSDRLGTRRNILIFSTLFIAAGTFLLSLSAGPTIWAAVMIVGVVRDGFMAVILTMTIEVKGVGSKYAGTATGFVMIFIGLGNLFAPPVGNSFTEISARSPFVFWTVLALIGTLCIILTGKEGSRDAQTKIAAAS